MFQADFPDWWNCRSPLQSKIALDRLRLRGPFRLRRTPRVLVPATLHVYLLRHLRALRLPVAKSDRGNLRRDELETYRLLADGYLVLDEEGLATEQAAGAIVEVKRDD